MQKVPSLYQRDWNGDRHALRQVTPGTEWVLKGEGIATRKWDGTCCMVRAGVLYKRYEVKAHGTPPPAFEPATEPDPVTGKQQGWLPVGDGPEDRYHREAWSNACSDRSPPEDGTYELIGPKVQGNVEGVTEYRLIRHGIDVLADVPRDFGGIRDYLRDVDIEGIVWHHPDGRMAKIKKRDFGFQRGPGKRE